MKASQADPLRPLSFITTLTMGVLLAILVSVPLGILVSGGHVGYGAWGFDEACVEVPQQGLWIGGSDGHGHVDNLRPGVTEGIPHTLMLCQRHMDGLTRTLFTVPAVLDLVWTLGFFTLVMLLIRRARRHGLFTTQVARGVTRLGWYLVAGHVVCHLISGLCSALGTSRLVTDFLVLSGTLNDMDLSWPIIIAGFGVLSVGRIMRQSVEMHEDLEGTV